MPIRPALQRCAVVDLGSNSVRLVVFEGRGRNPVTLFNEKAVLRLGRGLQATGQLNPDGVEQAITVMKRFTAIAQAMGAAPFEVLTTAAVRDATNGPAFVEALRATLGPDVEIRVLSGEQEAAFSSAGLLCGIPNADGILADIGGGSLELVRLQGGPLGQPADQPVGQAVTLPLGVIRLSDRSGGDPLVARIMVDADFDTVPWIAPLPGETEGRDLYLVGGAWRALARVHMAQTAYPLNIVHHYVIGPDAARDLAQMIATAGRRALERTPGVGRRRIDDLPMAAVVLRRLLRSVLPRRVVFSANGLREGWFLSQVDAAVRAEDPLLAAGRDYAHFLGRDPALPPLLVPWTDPIFAGDTTEARRLRISACWMSDIGSRDHPEFRGEQAYYRVLRQPGIGLNHHARAFLALTLAVRYDAEIDAPFLATARALLDVATIQRAERLGVALRLAYTVCAGTAGLLASTSITLQPGRLCLRCIASPGDGVVRRLERLGALLGLEPALEEVS